MGGKDKTLFQKVLQKLTHQSDVTPQGLKKYDLVIIGGNLGGYLSRQFEAYDHGHHTTYVAFDKFQNIQQYLRPLYETQIVSDNNYTFSPKVTIANYCATSEGVPMTSVDPDKQVVTLDNGVSFEYDQLVLTMGTPWG